MEGAEGLREVRGVLRGITRDLGGAMCQTEQ